MSATQNFAAWMEHSPFALSVESFHDLTCIMCIPEQTNLGFSKVNFKKMFCGYKWKEIGSILSLPK